MSGDADRALSSCTSFPLPDDSQLSCPQQPTKQIGKEMMFQLQYFAALFGGCEAIVR